MRGTFTLLLALLFLLSACSSSSIITTWKDKSLVQRAYQKILVIGILKDSTTGLRQTMEEHFVSELKALGYNAVSSLEEFGAGGLRSLEQEETYVKLCNKGIDAVITIALLDKHKEHYYVPAKVKYYSSVYYYNRIWNYQKIQADPIGADADSANTQLLWETILFDLARLTPVYGAQTKPFDPTLEGSMAHTYGKMLVAGMVKSKTLFKQPVADQQPLKPF